MPGPPEESKESLMEQVAEYVRAGKPRNRPFESFEQGSSLGFRV